MKQQKPMSAYLQPSPYMNFYDNKIQQLIQSFHYENEVDKIKAVYEFVRDEIKHSYDIHAMEVTRHASEVLKKGHGICYAKSHLLAALLRAINVPAGIAYQRLTLYDKPEDGYCIHALNTVYLREYNKWIRLDARGNKKGVHAEFSIEKEKLAFPIRTHLGEYDYVINFAEPHPLIIRALESYTDCCTMYNTGLPTDITEYDESENENRLLSNE